MHRAPAEIEWERMAAPCELRRPPIVEALVDLRAAVTAPPETFDALVQELREQYPTSAVQRGMKAELRVERGKLIPPTAVDLGFQGILLKNMKGPRWCSSDRMGLHSTT